MHDRGMREWTPEGTAEAAMSQLPATETKMPLLILDAVR